MTPEKTGAAEAFEFRTRLTRGMEASYERYHRSIPADLHAAMSDAGVIEWQILLSGDVVTHRIVADRAAMAQQLDSHPANLEWQRQVAPYLVEGDEPEAPDHPGPVIWEFTWPTR